MNMKIKIGTRGSKLALIQAEYVKESLKAAFPEYEYEIVVIKTKGDIIQNMPLNQIGDKGVFVKEIEEQLLSDRIHLAVHSMKDMPAYPAQGLVFSKLWKRADARDVLILREKHSFKELPQNAVIGTGSPRRARQLKYLRSDLKITDIRGNVDTRLRKMEEQKLDGIILAAAGLKRLGIEDKITCYFSTDEMIPAPAQGILALEIKKENTNLQAMLDALFDFDTNLAGSTERAFLEEIGGDCHIPVGAFCEITDGQLKLRAVYGREQDEKLYYAEVLGKTPVQTAKEAAKAIRKQMSGTVYLVGAGPGDTGLITVKGMELIKSADCIIYDRLASPELLLYAKESCEKIYAGKETHHHTMNQEEINRLLVKKSMEYEKTVRLKGGDSYVFGRGGEEALFLRNFGIRFEIIPGVSSAIAGPAYAGIPVTHRGTAGGFRVVTAHNREDGLAEIDFKAMAKNKDTCIFLMGLGKLGEIVENLIKAGMSSCMNVAVISNATRPEQKTVVSNLKQIEQKVKEAELVSPALIVVGNVVKLREALNFFEEKPLFGKRYLVPKINSEPSRLAVMLRDKGAYVKEIQVGKIVYKSCKLEREKWKDWIIFTSVNGIDGFFACLRKNGLDARALFGCKIAVIGKKTGKKLEEYGIVPDFIPEEYNSGALWEELKEIFQKEGKMLSVGYPCAINTDRTNTDRTNGDKINSDKEYVGKAHMDKKYADEIFTKDKIKRKLQDICCVEHIPVYENQAVEIEKIEPENYMKWDAVLFTCSSSVQRMVEAYGEKLLKIPAVSIGKKCSETLRKLGAENIIEAEQSEYESMAEVLIKKVM